MLNGDEQRQIEFDRCSDFYRAEYSSHLRRVTSLGSLEFIDLHQPGGDFSDKGTHDVFIQRSLSRIGVAANLGYSILWISRRLDAWRDWPRSRTSSPVEWLSRGALNRCIERIDASTNDPASLEEPAALTQFSMFHFCRGFKAATGLPPLRYQIVRRLGGARDMLANTALSVAELANAVGYEEVIYFTRLFRRGTGFPPGQWRRERLR